MLCIVAFLLRLLLALVPYLDVVLSREPFNGLLESHILVLHKKGDGIATLATAEAVEAVACRIHIERRRLLAVERAASPKSRTFLMELDKVADNAMHIGCINDPLFALFSNIAHININKGGIDKP